MDIFKRLHKTGKSINNAITTVFAREPFLTFINIPHHSASLALKRFIDINISLIAFILLFPFMLILAAIIKIDSKGPVIFKQERVGLRGRKFLLYKFRTMVQDAEKLKTEVEDKNEVDGPVFKIENNPRITKAGRFLRKTGLDELPQLLNILKGEMSLICQV